MKNEIIIKPINKEFTIYKKYITNENNVYVCLPKDQKITDDIKKRFKIIF
tara:strand:+ start:235 stop:384 length:150 start_codon:yes stop_codon:yes gene_type:complete